MSNARLIAACDQDKAALDDFLLSEIRKDKEVVKAGIDNLLEAVQHKDANSVRALGDHTLLVLARFAVMAMADSLTRIGSDQ